MPSPPVIKKKTTAPAPTPVVKVKAAAKKPAVQSKQSLQSSYDLNGKVIVSSTKKYLLVGKLIKSSSKRSQIYYAYESNKENEPIGSRLIIKISNYLDRLSRENKNYNRVSSKGRVAFSFFKGSDTCFVRKVDFIPNCDDLAGITKGIPSGSSALVLESGDQNLRVFLEKKQQQDGLSGSELRKAAVNVCRCVEAMHSSGLVWTDLKAENFVLTGTGGDDNNQEVKGIDLESCVTFNSNPEDYSPEATPPEFALAEKQNIGYKFKVQKNYDIWSLGMLLLELSTGKSYFNGKSEDSITKLLANAEVMIINPKTKSIILNEKQINSINDNKLQDLILSCLQFNPNKRPSITQVLFHPYFLTTGIGPITF